MKYKIEDIASIVNGELILHDNANNTIDEIAYDSRNVSNATHALFVCIVTVRNDGHKYIEDLFSRGVKNFLVSNKNYTANIKANFIVVENTVAALQLLAAFHRKQYDIPVLGITGSNGKTVVKEWLYQLLHNDYNIVRSPKSFNSQIGVPLSILQMNGQHTLAVIEAGISQPNEMEKLAKVIAPTIGILTHMGEAHSENFESTKEKLNEKLKLFSSCNTLVYNANDTAIAEAVNKWHTHNNKVGLLSWSHNSDATLHHVVVTKLNNQTEISGNFQSQTLSVRIPFTDEASIENAISCWCILLILKVPIGIIAQRMLMLHSIAMRLEMLHGINNCVLVNDSYNSDVSSLRIALDYINQLQKPLQKTIILSDILQSGIPPAKLYSDIATMLEQKGITKIIGIGTELPMQAEQFKIKKMFYQTTADFLQHQSANSFNNEMILIKGARAFEFEKISAMLQEKSHATILEINLDALVHNFNFYKSKLAPQVKTMCMVKAFAYGGGSFEIANTLQFHRADYLAVAYTDEGVDLRKAGITLPIMVMNVEVQSFDNIVEYNLQPELYSMRIIHAFLNFIATKKSQQQYSVHIKLDTGMHRLGFVKEEIAELCTLIKSNGKLKVESVFSHLAASDESAHREFTLQQINNFNATCIEMEEKLGTTFLKHIANSSAIVQYPSSHFNMVRLGIGLHGIGNTAQENNGLQMVSRLKTTITQIKKVAAGETVGYSRKAKLNRESDIATIAIGYADGLSRRAGNGAYTVTVNGNEVQTVGNVCMDMLMIDVTGIPCNEGDEVIIFDSRPSILKLANAMQSVAYEVLTGISQRVKRVYVNE